MKKPKKIKCEICGLKQPKALHLHHLTERVEANCTNHPLNLLVACGSCHSLIHQKIIEVIGIWPSSNPTNGRIVVFKKEGRCNIPELENVSPPHISQAPRMKIYGKT